jgi:hypothetical protein
MTNGMHDDTPGAWAADPWRRFTLRWHDGIHWTSHVTDGTEVLVDPPGIRADRPFPPPSPAAHPAGPPPAATAEHVGPAPAPELGGEGDQLRGHYPPGTAVDQQHQGGRRQADRESLE